MRFTTLSAIMGTENSETNHEKFLEFNAKKYEFIKTPEKFKQVIPCGRLGGKFLVNRAGENTAFKHDAFMITMHECVCEGEDHLTKCEQIHQVPKDLYLTLLNDVLKWLPKGLKSIKASPLFKVEARSKIVKAYTSVLFKELRESVREVDETPMPCANMDGTSPKPKSLREFSKAHSMPFYNARAELMWYAQNPRPWDVLDNSFMLMRAHYNRVAPQAFLRYLGGEYAVSMTDYVKWFSRVSVSMFTKYADKRDTLVCGVDNYMDEPLEQYLDDVQQTPLRGIADIDYMGVNPKRLTRKEASWWAGELYRVNIRKDGMRRVKGELASAIGKFLGVTYRTVERSAIKETPLTTLSLTVKAVSEKQSGFKGISGDWVVNYKPEKKSKWTPPWEQDW